jgi:hypothetical protein
VDTEVTGVADYECVPVTPYHFHFPLWQFALSSEFGYERFNASDVVHFNVITAATQFALIR